jgi:hypothetical protein
MISDKYIKGNMDSRDYKKDGKCECTRTKLVVQTCRKLPNE